MNVQITEPCLLTLRVALSCDRVSFLHVLDNLYHLLQNTRPGISRQASCPYQRRHRRMNLAYGHFRVFFFPTSVVLATGTGNSRNSGLNGVSTPDSGDPPIGPTLSRSFGLQSIVLLAI